MGITTKTGDDGYTDILNGERLRKDHPVVECLGTFDELNAFLGDAKASVDAAADANAYGVYISDIITGIQKDLFLIMSIIAGMSAPEEVPDGERLNSLINQLESELPPFTSFAVPGANPASAKLHIARAVCRRAERRLISLNGENSPAVQAKTVIPYINRLSDLLFLLARKAALAEPKINPKEKFHIYLAFGQSNMAGYLGPPIGTWGNSGSQAWVASGRFDKPPENFVVMAAANDNKNPYGRKKGEWHAAKPPLVRNNTGLSPADFFGRTVAGAAAAKGIKVGVIVIAVDGCQITLFSKDKNTFINYISAQEEYMRNQAAAYVDAGVGGTIPATAFTTKDYPYKRMVDLAKLAQKEGVIKGIIMHQGESGGNLPGKTYAQTVRQIYDDLCGDLGLEKGKTPFLAGQAVENNNDNINSIPVAFTDLPNTAFVIPSDGCPGWNPNSADSNEKIHFSLEAYEELGKRYGRKMLELLY